MNYELLKTAGQKLQQKYLSIEKPESIEEVYKLLTNLHIRESLKKTYSVELGTIQNPRSFTVMRMDPSDMPNYSIYCSLDLNAPFCLACYHYNVAPVWYI